MGYDLPMPELPEVETIRRGLSRTLAGRRVVGGLVRERRLRRPVDLRGLGRVKGTAIAAVHRRGKYLLIEIDTGATLLVHLGMTGRLWVSQGSRPARPHEHVVFDLDDGRQLRFADSRRFGLIELVPNGHLKRHPLLEGLGPEPLDAAWSAAGVHAVTRKRRAPVKNVLMDARTVVGIGNIYACEALHRAGVSPRRAVGRIGQSVWERIVGAVREVLTEAIRRGGTTLRDYVDADENAGLFSVDLRVYGRQGEPCDRCGGRIRRIVMAGRGTFYCPGCQR